MATSLIANIASNLRRLSELFERSPQRLSMPPATIEAELLSFDSWLADAVSPQAGKDRLSLESAESGQETMADVIRRQLGPAPSRKWGK